MTAVIRHYRQQWFSLFAMAVCVLILQSCSTFSPMQAAETPEQKADAVYATFVAYQRQAVRIAESPATPDSVVRSLAAADAAAKPIMASLYDAQLRYAQIKAEIEAGETSEDALVVVSMNLERWTAEAIPLVFQLISAVQAIGD